MGRSQVLYNRRKGGRGPGGRGWRRPKPNQPPIRPQEAVQEEEADTHPTNDAMIDDEGSMALIDAAQASHRYVAPSRPQKDRLSEPDDSSVTIGDRTIPNLGPVLGKLPLAELFRLPQDLIDYMGDDLVERMRMEADTVDGTTTETSTDARTTVAVAPGKPSDNIVEENDDEHDIEQSTEIKDSKSDIAPIESQDSSIPSVRQQPSFASEFSSVTASLDRLLSESKSTGDTAVDPITHSRKAHHIDDPVMQPVVVAPSESLDPVIGPIPSSMSEPESIGLVTKSSTSTADRILDTRSQTPSATTDGAVAKTDEMDAWLDKALQTFESGEKEEKQETEAEELNDWLDSVIN